MENIIFSKVKNEFIPVRVEKRWRERDPLYGVDIIQYSVYPKDNSAERIGIVRLYDTIKGCFVRFMRNENPEKYKFFGDFADRLEVQHCLNKGMDDFEILSEAAMNSHAKHFMRGKRFLKLTDEEDIAKLKEIWGTADVNKIVKCIINHTQKGEFINTHFLPNVPMYMPKELIQKYIAELLKSPIVFK